MGAILTFVLGALLSIPLSVVANLLTPKWQAYWSKRSERIRDSNSRKHRLFQQQMSRWADHPAELTMYVLRLVSLMIPLLGIIVMEGVAVGVTMSSPDLVKETDSTERRVLATVAVVLSLLLLLWMGQIMRRIWMVTSYVQMIRWTPDPEADAA
ncbi:hypothetical protein Ait01nite_053190 [Actinoplanes italicus]|uniref:Uncharacterized protein n=1 Tax=Actinoplanes italicus TaxID=113567 RepID=A0A2T0JZL2_9ACTN|nr:hypothetical protein [Actinoplanes italicus]PRX15967.1 hypothetical protein CLV67_12114 [Actinoplanes italicus]GIE32274.1 hypothetical protein Ait01nite_053190 [Actinoplanes italicus]